jgi:hypothetical protein
MVGFLLMDEPLMMTELTRLIEGHGTSVALVRFFPSVDPLMAGGTCFSCERLGAMRAGECFFTCVTATMISEVTRVISLVITVLTSELLLFLMGIHHMIVQVSFRRPPVAALITFPLPLLFQISAHRHPHFLLHANRL